MKITATPYQFRYELTDEQKSQLTTLATAVAQGIQGLSLVGMGYHKTISSLGNSIAATIGDKLAKKYAHPVYQCVTGSMNRRRALIMAEIRAELDNVYSKEFIQQMRDLAEYASVDEYGTPETLERWGNSRLLTHYLRNVATMEDDINHLCGYGWTLEYSLHFLRIYDNFTGTETGRTYWRDEEWQTSTEKLREYHIKASCDDFMGNVMGAACKSADRLQHELRRADFLVREDGEYRLTAPARAMFNSSIEIPETHNNPTLRVIKEDGFSSGYHLQVLEDDGWHGIIFVSKLREVCARLETAYARHLKDNAFCRNERVRSGKEEPDLSPEFATLCEFYGVELITEAQEVTLYRVLHDKYLADEKARLEAAGERSYNARYLNMEDYILSTATWDMEQAEGYLREVAVFPNETEAKQVKDDLRERQRQINQVESYQNEIEDIKERIAECIKQAGEYDRVYQQYGAPFEEDVKED
jgi:hypothetical protein